MCAKFRYTFTYILSSDVRLSNDVLSISDGVLTIRMILQFVQCQYLFCGRSDKATLCDELLVSCRNDQTMTVI